jgi:glucosamine--fructose-6-phosphate aminotransferase (isomerizing)
VCGLVGIASPVEFPSRLLLERLRRLEYRGYDSFGFFDSKNLKKSVGGIRLAAAEGRTRLGLAHTRWATHGGVTEVNAHPHLSCDGRVVVVHNGIIENYEEVKRRLSGRGHVFRSETDSEVIAHYFEEGLKGRPLAALAPDFFRTFRGTFAVLVMVRGRDEILALKRDSPLVLGATPGRTILASDMHAFADLGGRLAYFGDDEYALVRPDGFRFYDRRGRALRKTLTRFAPLPAESSSKRSYKHYMLKEIMDEPEAVERLLASLDREQKPAFDRLVRMVRRARKVFFAACGTSYHASLLGAFFLHQLGIENQTLIASEFRHYANIHPDTLVIALSQSGETLDVSDALKYTRENGGRIASLVNVPHSTIQRLSDLSLNILAGPEVCVASTKTFVNQAALLLRLAREFGFRVNLDNLALRIRGLLRRRDAIRKIAGRIASARDVYVIGRGLTYPVAREISLKIKEISYIHAEGMMGGELKHGTIALIEKGTPVISLVNNSDPDILSNTREVEARGGRPIIITNNPARGGAGRPDTIAVETDNDGKFGILAAVAGQLIAYYAADKLGRPIDKPRNLAKSVTVK